MKIKSTFAIALIATAFATPVLAQPAAPTGGTVLTSEPGKATAVSAVSMSAQVVGLEKATRTITLKGPKGNVFDIVAGDEVKNFDQIKLGDSVDVRYLEALTLELRKTKGASGDGKIREEAAQAKPG